MVLSFPESDVVGIVRGDQWQVFGLTKERI
jgi:hypothetical protein